MLFKNFDVDRDKVTIDSQVILKPQYLSVSQWIDFWSFSSEASEFNSVEDAVRKEVDAIVSKHEYGHELELEHQAKELRDEFNARVENLLKNTRDKFYEIEDLIEKTRSSMND